MTDDKRSAAEDDKLEAEQFERAKVIAEDIKELCESGELRLERLLRLNEELLREAIGAEVLVEGERRRQTELRGKLRKLKSEQRTIESESGSLTDATSNLEEALKSIEERRAEQEKITSELRGEIARAEDEVKSLDKECGELDRRRQKLEDDIHRLRKLREEYQAAIAKLREEREGLVSDVSR